MANPQVQNGYTRIANEILEEAMKVSLNGTQFRILLAVWRFTYGFRRKEYEMSISFLADVTKASRSQIDRELNALIKSNILAVSESGKRNVRVIRFNKNHDEWMDCSPERGQSNIKKTIKHKKKKNTSTKNKYAKDNLYYRMAIYFHNKVSAVAEAEGLSHLIIKSDLQKWSDDMRKLIEIDKIDMHLAKEVMDWVTADSFWKTNVLSAKKLREKFGELAIKMKASQKPKQNKQQHSDPRDRELSFQRWVQEGNDPDGFDWS